MLLRSSETARLSSPKSCFALYQARNGFRYSTDTEEKVFYA